MNENELRKRILESFNSEKDMERIFSPRIPLSKQINKRDLARLQAGDRCCPGCWVGVGSGDAYCTNWEPDC